MDREESGVTARLAQSALGGADRPRTRVDDFQVSLTVEVPVTLLTGQPDDDVDFEIQAI